MSENLSLDDRRIPTVFVRGAGVIGLSCAWELARRGASVTLYDVAPPGRGASWAAAGMLAPTFEAAGAKGVHPKLYELCQMSADAWLEFSAALEQASGFSSGYSETGALAVGQDDKTIGEIERRVSALDQAGAPFRILEMSDARAAEPALGADLRFAVELPNDHQVDNRAVVSALLEAATRAGVKMAREPDEAAAADIEVLCTGWRTPGVSPVGGQMLAIEPHRDHPRRVVRAGSIYIAPKPDRTIIGATVEPGRVDTATDNNAIDALRSEAAAICPGLVHGRELERWAGVRPATPDHAPILGWRGDRTYVAAGHYRNGVLLAPITAQIVADAVLDGASSSLAHAFAETRFQGAAK